MRQIYIDLIIRMVIMVVAIVTLAYLTIQYKNGDKLHVAFTVLLVLIIVMVIVRNIVTLGLYLGKKMSIEYSGILTRYDKMTNVVYSVIISYIIIKYTIKHLLDRVYDGKVSDKLVSFVLAPYSILLLGSIVSFIYVTVKQFTTKPDYYELMHTAYLSDLVYILDDINKKSPIDNNKIIPADVVAQAVEKMPTVTDGHVKSALLKSNYYYSYNKSTETSVLIALYGGNIYISFPGTASLKDAESDGDIASRLYVLPPYTSDITSPTVHDGFYRAYSSLREFVVSKVKDIESLLPAQYDMKSKKFEKISDKVKIVATGHSLGGAIATLCIFDLAHSGYKNTYLYTFGAPSVGDNLFMRDFNDAVTKAYRIVNPMDPIPYSMSLQFPHVGNEYYVFNVDTYTVHAHSVDGYIVSLNAGNNNKIKRYMPVIMTGSFMLFVLCTLIVFIIIYVVVKSKIKKRH